MKTIIVWQGTGAYICKRVGKNLFYYFTFDYIRAMRQGHSVMWTDDIPTWCCDEVRYLI